MTPEKMFHELLGLGLNWEVVESRLEPKTSTVVLEIRETEGLWQAERCPRDGGLVYCYDHTEKLVWRHLNVFEHRCEIHCALPRKKCRQCGSVFRVQPPWEGLSGHLSKEFEAYALLLLRQMPAKQVARIVGESDTRLWRLLFKHVERAYAQADFSQLCCVGVDELNVRKGQQYVSVMADLLAKRVVFATPGKDTTTWSRFLETLEQHHGRAEALTQVSMDMSGAYRSAVAHSCPHSEVVFDKFHVIAHVNEALGQVRRNEVRLGGKGVWEQLRGSYWIWRKNPEQLSDKEKARLEQIQQQKLCTAKAYQMRLSLQEIYALEDPHRARHRLVAWCRWVQWIARKDVRTLWTPMRKAANMIQKHLEGILAHWKWRVTNAFMEGLNSVFQATKRKARGYRSTHYLITMLYLISGKLRLPQC